MPVFGQAARNATVADMKLSRLQWYAARLAAMSPPEVLHRVREAALKHRWKGNRRGWDNFSDIGNGALPEFPAVRARLAGGVGRIAESMASLDKGMYAALGQVVPAFDSDVWFRDPVSGTLWPKDSYCFAIDVRSTGKDRGDVKFVWEINRLQFLHPVAAHIAATGDAAAIEKAFAILAKWAAANPPYRGVNWFSGIELAMRMVTLTLLVTAMPASAWTDDRRVLMRKLIAAHGFWLHRYPSKYSSANNHLVAEGLGLLLAGMLAPDLEHAIDWEHEGRAILENEATLQIFADGVGGEQSPTYQAFTMEMLAFGALMAENAGRPLAPIVASRLRAGAEFLRALMDTAGLPPRIGDDDEGRVIAAPPDREPRYVASVVAMVAGLLREAALLPPDRDPHLRDAIFAVPEGLGTAPNGLHTFQQGGYSVLRTEIAGRKAVLTFDHGPLGYLSLAAHGHADALALWLSLDDVPVLVDAGTYLYHSGGALRNALRSSLAHNTLTIAGASQSLPSSAFSWSVKAGATPESIVKGADWSISASHDGYQKRFGVRHHRTIRRIIDGFSISDHLAGASAPLPVSLGFLLGPDVTAREESGGFSLVHNGHILARLTLPAGMTGRVVRNDHGNGQGLYSPRFGEVASNDQIIIEGQLAGDAVVTELKIIP